LKNIQIPSDTDLRDVPALVMWTIGACSLKVIDERHPGDDVREYQVQFQNSIHVLRILRMHGYGFVVYLDSYGIKLPNSQIEQNALGIPLRIFIACVAPIKYGSAVISLQSIPAEPLSDTIQFLDMETIGNLSSTSTWFNEFSDSDEVWEYILKSLDKYANGSFERLPVDSNETLPFKERVHAAILSNDRRRMVRFSRTIEAADWATPVEFLSPTAAIRRRRYNRRVLQDMIL